MENLRISPTRIEISIKAMLTSNLKRLIVSYAVSFQCVIELTRALLRSLITTRGNSVQNTSEVDKPNT